MSGMAVWGLTSAVDGSVNAPPPPFPRQARPWGDSLINHKHKAGTGAR